MDHWFQRFGAPKSENEPEPPLLEGKLGNHLHEFGLRPFWLRRRPSMESTYPQEGSSYVEEGNKQSTNHL